MSGDPRRELVTAALLGTDRRPVVTAVDEDPATVLLERAARSATLARAGRPLPGILAPTRGPTGHPPWASPSAQEVMHRLLVRPHPVLLNLWLAAAAGRGLGLVPQHWPALVAYADRTLEVSRPALGQVLGEAGRWFVGQNPQWVRLAGALTGAAARPLTGASTGLGVDTAARVVEPDHLGVDPELIFVVADPWPRSLVEAVLMIIGTARLQWRTSAYAASVAARLPYEHLPLVESARTFIDPPDGPPAPRVVREAFAALDHTLALRVEIDQAFGVPVPGPVTEETP